MFFFLSGIILSTAQDSIMQQLEYSFEDLVESDVNDRLLLESDQRHLTTVDDFRANIHDPEKCIKPKKFETFKFNYTVFKLRKQDCGCKSRKYYLMCYQNPGDSKPRLYMYKNKTWVKTCLSNHCKPPRRSQQNILQNNAPVLSPVRTVQPNPDHKFSYFVDSNRQTKLIELLRPDDVQQFLALSEGRVLEFGNSWCPYNNDYRKWLAKAADRYPHIKMAYLYTDRAGSHAEKDECIGIGQWVRANFDSSEQRIKRGYILSESYQMPLHQKFIMPLHQKFYKSIIFEEGKWSDHSLEARMKQLGMIQRQN